MRRLRYPRAETTMLITSDFHDYYDRAAVHGVDKTVVYRRKLELITTAPDSHVGLRGRIDKRFYRVPLPNSKTEYGISEHVVGYCGTLYPLLRITEKAAEPAGAVLMLAYTPEDFEAWIATLPPMNPRAWNYPLAFERPYRQRFFTTDFSRLKALFDKHRVPLFLYTRRFGHEDHGDLTLNPNLRELDFQRHKSAPAAFQDIFMYLSGVLGAPETPTLQLSDEMIQAKHGLDGKYSFKKPPGKNERWR